MDQQPAAAKDATIQMWLACALGQQYRMLAAAGASEQDLRPVSDRAYEAVKASLDAGMPLSWLQLLINPSDSRKTGQAQREREDDLEPFFMEQRFKQLLKL